MSRSYIGLVIVGALATGCEDQLCNGLYVQSGLVIGVENTPGPGAYELVADADGEHLQVGYAVDGDGRVTCVDHCRALSASFKLGLVFDSEGSTTQDLRFAIVRGDGSGLGPDAVDLRVLRGQAVLFDQHVDAMYSTSEPYGDGCGEVSAATVNASLAP